MAFPVASRQLLLNRRLPLSQIARTLSSLTRILHSPAVAGCPGGKEIAVPIAPAQQHVADELEDRRLRIRIGSKRSFHGLPVNLIDPLDNERGFHRPNSIFPLAASPNDNLSKYSTAEFSSPQLQQGVRKPSGIDRHSRFRQTRRTQSLQSPP